jgi:AcrR family transcriptional regulator
MEMPKKPIDRRIARTRAMLQEAHISLILEKGYEATTVEDICDAANVGRSTFYAHYTSKDDLRRSGLEHCAKNSSIGRGMLSRRREMLEIEAWASA